MASLWANYRFGAWGVPGLLAGAGARIDAALFESPVQAAVLPAERRWVIWFLGNGEPKQLNAPEAVKRFRHLVVDVHGGRVHHDGLGPMGCGLAIHLPA